MGLFNRHETDENKDDDLQLTTQDGSRKHPVEESRPRSAGRYSIDDALELMRQLPNDPDERMMEVICKTLESANIRTSEVLRDANQKEQRIRKQYSDIEQEIANFQAQIDERQQQLEQLGGSLEEITEIKSRFETVAGAAAHTSQPAEKPSQPLDRADATMEEQSPFTEDSHSQAQSLKDDQAEPESTATPISAGRRGRGARR